jgi:hypothetical protein
LTRRARPRGCFPVGNTSSGPHKGVSCGAPAREGVLRSATQVLDRRMAFFMA